MKIYAALLFLSVCGGGVANGAAQIPPGTYLAPDKVESVVVRNDGLEFSHRIPKLNPDTVVTRGPYRYTVSSGEIRVEPPANDSVFVFGIWYKWSWNGKSIVRRETKTGKTVTFTFEASDPATVGKGLSGEVKRGFFIRWLKRMTSFRTTAASVSDRSWGP